MIDIQAVVKKVDELKALFVLAQRVLPFMEELFTFIGDTTPLLEEVNNAIQENLKKMPNASRQLSKVTEATEMATTEIMDIVDRITNDLFVIIDDLEILSKIDEQRIQNPINLLETIAESIKNEKDLTVLLPDINFFIDRMKNATTNEHIEIISKTKKKLNEMAEEANSIIMSLQMQDITAQQLAAVNHLLESIQKRLSKIMKQLNSHDKEEGVKDLLNHDDEIKISKLHRSIAFDPDAVESIGRKDTRQANVDTLIEDINSGKDINDEENVNVDDLLASFSNQVEDNEEQEEQNKNEQSSTSAENDADNLEEISQDDIDALFGNV